MKKYYKKFGNEKLILRDYLAADRTVLANERTFLSYIRTALAFLITGLSLIKFFDSIYALITGITFLIIAFITFSTGVYRFIKIKMDIQLISKNKQE